uniref:Haloacid dehalogenase-like hydrolase n=1 Tax=Parastrongyloides trichosuri TaxID=131310 RepID=A0A0N4ZBH0_PARTI
MALRFGVLLSRFFVNKQFIIRSSSSKVEMQYVIPAEGKEHRIDKNINFENIFEEKRKVIKKVYLEKPKLIIFDKDGTLICFHAMWVPWVKGYVENIEKISGILLSSILYKRLGFCAGTEKVLPGLLAEGTMKQIRDATINILISFGVSKKDAEEIVTKVSIMMKERQEKGQYVKQVTDLQQLLGDLKSDNIKVAICTSDSRKNTLHTLTILGITPFIDYIGCGDDDGSIPKPDPSNALKICSRLNVSPSQTLMVGDTLTDLKMAHYAKLAGGIGVLTGVGNDSLLRPYSKLMVNDVSQIPHHFK